MDADEFIARLKPVVEYRGTAAAAQAEPLLQWFRVLCTRILEEPHPDVVALEQRYNPERDLNKVRMFVLWFVEKQQEGRNMGTTRGVGMGGVW